MASANCFNGDEIPWGRFYFVNCEGQPVADYLGVSGETLGGRQCGKWFYFREFATTYTATGESLTDFTARLSRALCTSVIGADHCDSVASIDVVEAKNGEIVISSIYIGEFFSGRPNEPLSDAFRKFLSDDEASLKNDPGEATSIYYHYIDNRFGVDYLTDRNGYAVFERIVYNHKISVPNENM